MPTRFGTGKKTKHVELRFLYVQDLVQMGLLRMAKIDGTRSPSALMTKCVATHMLQRLKSQLGVVSNWLKGNVDSDAHMTDDHVAALNAHCIHHPSALSARSLHCACMYSACAVRECFSRRRRTEVHAAGLKRMSF